MTAYNDIKGQLKGSLVALITPMHEDSTVNYEQLEELIEWHIAEGTDAIVAVGTTGESATLRVEEHIKVIEFCVQKIAGRVPLIAGTGANSTHEAINLTTRAKEAGADCALIVVPYYNKPSQEGIYQHYKTIAEAVDMPQILYNVPGRTVVDMSQETIERLADIDNIIAIKDATGDIDRGAKLIQALGDRMTVFSGDDPTALELMKVGGKGNISVTANVVPKQMAQVFGLALEGEFDKAEAIDKPIQHLHTELFIESSPAPTKYALYKMGRIDKGIRLPLVWLSEQNQPILDEAINKASLL